MAIVMMIRNVLFLVVCCFMFGRGFADSHLLKENWYPLDKSVLLSEFPDSLINHGIGENFGLDQSDRSSVLENDHRSRRGVFDCPNLGNTLDKALNFWNCRGEPCQGPVKGLIKSFIANSTAVYRGKLARLGHESSKRDVHIYVPDEYYLEENADKRYPVLIFLHGFVHIPAITSTSVAYALEHLFSLGIVRPFIMAMPDGHTKTGGSFWTNSPLVGDFEDFVHDEVLPYVHNTYRTFSGDRSKTCVAGFSMGGLGAFNLGLRHQDTFGCLASMSPVADGSDLAEVFSFLLKREWASTGPTPWNFLPDPCGSPEKQITNAMYAFSAVGSPNDEGSSLKFFNDSSIDDTDFKMLSEIFSVDTMFDGFGNPREDIFALQSKMYPTWLLDTFWNDASNTDIYLEVGTGDSQGFYPGIQDLREKLSSKGISYTYNEFPGFHDNRIHERLPIVFEWVGRFFEKDTPDEPPTFKKVKQSTSGLWSGAVPAKDRPDDLVCIESMNPKCNNEIEKFSSWQACYNSVRNDLLRKLELQPYAHGEWRAPNVTESYDYKQGLLRCCGNFRSDGCQNRCTSCISKLEPVCGKVLDVINIDGDPIYVVDKVQAECGTLSDTLKTTLVILLVFLMFGMGCSSDLAMIRKHLRHPKGIIIGWISQFLIMPLVAFCLSKWFGFSNHIALGVLIVGSSPGGTTSNLFSYIGKADVSLSISMTIMSSIGATFMMPFLLYAYGSAFVDDQVTIPYGEIVTQLMIVILPAIVGVFLRAFHKELANLGVKIGSAIGIAVIIISILVGSFENKEVFTTVSFQFYVVAVIIGLCGFSLGVSLTYLCDWFGRTTGKWGPLTPAERRAIALETGIQNGALAIGLSIISFPASIACRISLFPMIYSVIVVAESFLISLGMHLYWSVVERQKEEERERERIKKLENSGKMIENNEISLWRLGFWFTGFFFLAFLISAIAFYFSYLDQAYKHVEASLIPSDQQHKEYNRYIGNYTLKEDAEYNVPVTKNYYLFNLTNPSEYLAGGKPSFNEVGPFRYIVRREKIDVCFSDEDSVRYRKKVYFTADHGPTDLKPNSQRITSINVAYLKTMKEAGGESLVAVGVGGAQVFEILEACFVDSARCSELKDGSDTFIDSVFDAAFPATMKLIEDGFTTVLVDQIISGGVPLGFESMDVGFAVLLPEVVISGAVVTGMDTIKTSFTGEFALQSAKSQLPTTFATIVSAFTTTFVQGIKLSNVPAYLAMYRAVAVASIGASADDFTTQWVSGTITWGLGAQPNDPGDPVGKSSIIVLDFTNFPAEPEIFMYAHRQLGGIDLVAIGWTNTYANTLLGILSNETTVKEFATLAVVAGGSDPAAAATAVGSLFAMGIAAVNDISILGGYLTYLMDNLVDPMVVGAFAASDSTITDIEGVAYFQLSSGMVIAASASSPVGVSIKDVFPDDYDSEPEIGMFSLRYGSGTLAWSAAYTKVVMSIISNNDTLVSFVTNAALAASGDSVGAATLVGLGISGPNLATDVAIISAYIEYSLNNFTIPALVQAFAAADPTVTTLVDVGYMQWGTGAVVGASIGASNGSVFDILPGFFAEPEMGMWWIRHEPTLNPSGAALGWSAAKSKIVLDAISDAIVLPQLILDSARINKGDVQALTRVTDLGISTADLPVILAYLDYQKTCTVTPGTIATFAAFDPTVTTAADIGYMQWGSGIVMGAALTVPMASLKDVQPMLYGTEPEFALWNSRNYGGNTTYSAAQSKAILQVLKNATALAMFVSDATAASTGDMDAVGRIVSSGIPASEIAVISEYLKYMTDHLITPGSISLFNAEDSSISETSDIGYLQWTSGTPVGMAIPGLDAASVKDLLPDDYDSEPEFIFYIERYRGVSDSVKLTVDYAKLIFQQLSNVASFPTFWRHLKRAAKSMTNTDSVNFLTDRGINTEDFLVLHDYAIYVRDRIIFPQFQRSWAGALDPSLEVWSDVGYLQLASGSVTGFSLGIPALSVQAVDPASFPSPPELAMYARQAFPDQAGVSNFTRPVKYLKKIFQMLTNQDKLMNFLVNANNANIATQKATAATKAGDWAAAAEYTKEAEKWAGAVLVYGMTIDDIPLFAGYILDTVPVYAAVEIEDILCNDAMGCSPDNGFWHGSGFISTRTAQEWIEGWRDPLLVLLLGDDDPRVVVKQAESFPFNHTSSWHTMRTMRHTEENTGATNSSLIGRVEVFENVKVLPSKSSLDSPMSFLSDMWSFSGYDEYYPLCGNNGKQFEPIYGIDEDASPEIWVDSFMRCIKLAHKGKIDFKGIAVERFVLSDESLAEKKLDNVMSGTIDLKVRGVPVVVSLPMFERIEKPLMWGAGGVLAVTENKNSDGVVLSRQYESAKIDIDFYSDPKDWELFVDIEPISGKTLRGASRAQLNIRAPTTEQDVFNQKVRKDPVLLPHYWSTEDSEAPDVLIAIAKDNINEVEQLPMQILISFIVLSVLCLIGFVPLSVHIYRHRRDADFVDENFEDDEMALLLQRQKEWEEALTAENEVGGE